MMGEAEFRIQNTEYRILDDEIVVSLLGQSFSPVGEKAGVRG